MQYTVQAEVIGVKKFSGKIDGEAIHPATTLFVVMEMEKADTKTADGEIGRAGSTVVQYRAEGFNVFEAIKAQKFPFTGDLVFEKTTTGSQGKSKETLVSVKPRGVVAR